MLVAIFSGFGSMVGGPPGSTADLFSTFVRFWWFPASAIILSLDEHSFLLDVMLGLADSVLVSLIIGFIWALKSPGHNAHNNKGGAQP